MTTKKFERLTCDRCGFTAELVDDDCLRGWEKQFKSISIFPRVDLCADCRSSLISWFRDGTKFKS
jgi:hypothetical protein